MEYQGSKGYSLSGVWHADRDIPAILKEAGFDPQVQSTCARTKPPVESEGPPERRSGRGTSRRRRQAVPSKRWLARGDFKLLEYLFIQGLHRQEEA